MSKHDDVIRYRCARCGTHSASCERCPKCMGMLCSTCKMPYYDGTTREHNCVEAEIDGKEPTDGK